MASAAVTSKKTKSPTANKNYSANLAKGGSVTVKDGVKTYSDKSLQVKGKGGISISGKDYSVNKGGSGFAPTTSVITADKMKPVPPIPLATPAPVDGLGTTTAQGSASLAAKMGGTYDIKSGTITPPVPPTEPAKTGMDAYTEMFNAQNAALKSAGEDRFSYEDAFNKTQKQLRPKEGLVNSIAGQLNVIQEKSNAAQLALEGQGRGQTGSFVGGEQARISREAAIQSMPLQAQLAIAQDDLDSARSYYTQYYQAKMQDSQNEYNLKKENIQNLYGFLTAQEERKAAASEKVLDRQYAESQQLMTAKAAAISNALGQGAPAAIQQAIDSATTLAGVATAAGKYNGDLLAQEAQRANIAQSYASIATSNTNRLLALAEAGDKEAIKKLKFDPRTIKEEVDPVTRRQLEGAVDSGANLLRLAEKYKKIIDTYGYTNTIGGDSTILGEISSLRALMTAEYKKAETLGTLDAGVLALMSQIVGEEPTSTYNPLTNITGRKSNKLSSQIGTFIENITNAQARDKARLGIEPQVDFSVIAEDDDAEINAGFGINTSTPSQGFSPQTFYK